MFARHTTTQTSSSPPARFGDSKDAQYRFAADRPTAERRRLRDRKLNRSPWTIQLCIAFKAGLEARELGEGRVCLCGCGWLVHTGRVLRFDQPRMSASRHSQHLHSSCIFAPTSTRRYASWRGCEKKKKTTTDSNFPVSQKLGNAVVPASSDEAKTAQEGNPEMDTDLDGPSLEGIEALLQDEPSTPAAAAGWSLTSFTLLSPSLTDHHPESALGESLATFIYLDHVSVAGVPEASERRADTQFVIKVYADTRHSSKSAATSSPARLSGQILSFGGLRNKIGIATCETLHFVLSEKHLLKDRVVGTAELHVPYAMRANPEVCLRRVCGMLPPPLRLSQTQPVSCAPHAIPLNNRKCTPSPWWPAETLPARLRTRRPCA